MYFIQQYLFPALGWLGSVWTAIARYPDIYDAGDGDHKVYSSNGEDELLGGSSYDLLDGGDNYVVDNAGYRVIETSASGGYDRVVRPAHQTQMPHLGDVSEQLPVETVVFVSNNRPNRGLYEELKTRGIEAHVAGDANSPRFLTYATLDRHRGGALIWLSKTLIKIRYIRVEAARQ